MTHQVRHPNGRTLEVPDDVDLDVYRASGFTVVEPKQQSPRRGSKKRTEEDE